MCQDPVYSVGGLIDVLKKEDGVVPGEFIWCAEEVDKGGEIAAKQPPFSLSGAQNFEFGRLDAVRRPSGYGVEEGLDGRTIATWQCGYHRAVKTDQVCLFEECSKQHADVAESDQHFGVLPDKVHIER